MWLQFVGFVYCVIPVKLIAIAKVVIGRAVWHHGNGNPTIAGHERNPKGTGILRELRTRELLRPKTIVVLEAIDTCCVQAAVSRITLHRIRKPSPNA